MMTGSDIGAIRFVAEFLLVVLCENPADSALSKPSEEASLGNLSPV
jgi:hypothetical protein